MLNLAIKSRSTWNGKPYTTPGLGDRVHHALCAYQYSKGKPITLHLTEDKFGKPHKKESWNQLQDMIPNVRIMVWPVQNLEEVEWINYLKHQGVWNIETYHYSDTRNNPQLSSQGSHGIDMSQYLKTLPCLEAPDVNGFFKDLPEKFATLQFDSTDSSRMGDVEKIKLKYSKEGYKLFVIGGQAKHIRLRTSLKHISHLIAKADIHVGVDSGMFHLAQLYKPWNKIHVYKGDFISHHLERAINNGVTII